MFAVCVLPVGSWTTLWFLHKVPSWQLFLGPWDILGILAYAQAFALLESAVMFLFVVLFCIIFPVRIPAEGFIAQGSMLTLTNVFWILVLHGVGGDIPTWSTPKMLALPVLYAASIGTSLALVRRSFRVEKLLEGFAERLVIMVYIYIPLGALGLIVVVARNILGRG